MNKIIIMGRVGQEPEIKYYGEGESAFAVATYSVAVDRPKGKNDEDAKTDWIPCKVLGKRAEFVEKYVKKGMRLLIEGRMQIDTWQDDDGNNKHYAYVHVLSQEFCESKSSNSENTSKPDQPSEARSDGFMDIPAGFEDELPFA